MKLSPIRLSFGVLALSLGLAAACSSGEEATSSDGSGGSGSGLGGGFGNIGGALSSGSGGSLTGLGGSISGLVYGDTECSDGIDNDGNGLIDGFDPECSGPLDNDESSFATGIPGDNKDPKQDCFFDGNSGAGDDDCDSTKDTQSQQCIDYCGSRVPNGCDCFGCCEIQYEGNTYNVKLGGTCLDVEDVGDPQKCEACVQAADCKNECGECELCPGKTLADLPASCGTDNPDGPGYTCDEGQTTCTDNTQCGGGFCQLGCCIPVIIR